MIYVSIYIYILNVNDKTTFVRKLYLILKSLN